MRQEEIAYLAQIESIDIHMPLTLRDFMSISGHSSEPSTLLDEVALETKWQHASGGQRRKAILQRLLQKRPKILFLDEPFNHLDKESISHIDFGLFSALSDGHLKGIVIIGHTGVDQLTHLRKFIWKEIST
jgi:zinc/manganese transport system ATP-binding protein/zinc transport system ATP-binding protein